LLKIVHVPKLPTFRSDTKYQMLIQINTTIHNGKI